MAPVPFRSQIYVSATLPTPQRTDAVTATREVLDGAWHVVLERSPRGDDAHRLSLLPLTASQRTLLQALDGEHSLRQLVERTPALGSKRLTRDAARLLAFGLVRQVHGELPQHLVVDAMNLTLHVPAAAFAPPAAAAPEADDEQAAPRAPRPPQPRLALAVTAFAVGLLALAVLSLWLINR